MNLVKLQDAMQDRNISKVAENLGITRQHLSNIIKGKSEPSNKLARRIDDYFGFREWPDDESRIDIIGQNGPTGDHYD